MGSRWWQFLNANRWCCVGPPPAFGGRRPRARAAASPAGWPPPPAAPPLWGGAAKISLFILQMVSLLRDERAREQRPPKRLLQKYPQTPLSSHSRPAHLHFCNTLTGGRRQKSNFILLSGISKSFLRYSIKVYRALVDNLHSIFVRGHNILD